VNYSWNEQVRRTLTPRFAAAIAASVLLHGLLVGSVPTPERGATAVDLPDPLRARISADEPAAKIASARPSSAAPAAPRYYRTRELDIVPGIMTRVQPEFPQYVHTNGKVVIRLFIDEAGTVEHVAIVRADPPGTFDASAQRAFLAAKFTPGMKGGVPVRTQVVLELSYTQPRR
jgi:protein TonB